MSTKIKPKIKPTYNNKQVKLSKILVLIDGSESSVIAAIFAIELAKNKMGN
jgi:hypothetical protein